MGHPEAAEGCQEASVPVVDVRAPPPAAMSAAAAADTSRSSSVQSRFRLEVPFGRVCSPTGRSRSGVRILSNLSSAETITPESGPLPSRVSAVETLASSSRPSRADLESLDFRGGTFPALAKAPSSSASACCSVCEDRRPLYAPYGAPGGGARAKGLPLPSEQRRRKYRPLSTPLEGFGMPSSCGSGPSATSPEVPFGTARSEGSTALVSIDSDRAAANEALIEGPLQQRAFLMFWRSRWCVLDRHELRIYSDEQESVVSSPLECHQVKDIDVIPDVQVPTVLIVSTRSRGVPIAYLRAGPGRRLEELVAASLWLRAFTAAGQGLAALVASSEDEDATRTSSAALATGGAESEAATS
eukprot:TRINITY_DN103933_c0_g1_i1.p1 TRINITY_DN103933_c0_g1~~TRINITY_DN103933_c0_g1_i1.p1  ORF type:complete len:357 (-),score=24.38 TRINITY_DN103933_c0_g1_i1:210-1280(-)